MWSTSPAATERGPATREIESDPAPPDREHGVGPRGPHELINRDVLVDGVCEAHVARAVRDRRDARAVEEGAVVDSGPADDPRRVARRLLVRGARLGDDRRVG